MLGTPSRDPALEHAMTDSNIAANGVAMGESAPKQIEIHLHVLAPAAVSPFSWRSPDQVNPIIPEVVL